MTIRFPWLHAFEFLLAIAGICCFFALLNFASALPVVHGHVVDENVAMSARVAVPSSWEAAVANHGAYFRWWRIDRQPWVFGSTLVMLIALIVVSRTIDKATQETRRIEKQRQPLAYKAANAIILVAIWVVMAAMVFWLPRALE